MGLFGFGKKKEKEQPKTVEMNAPVSVPENSAPKTSAPPQTADGICPACQRQLGSHPVELSDTKICYPCSLLLRGFFYTETSNGTTYDPLSKMAFEKAEEIIRISRMEIKGDLEDYADKYSFVADVDDVEEFGSGYTLAKVLVAKGGNPKGRRATIIREEEVIGFALIEDAIPCAGRDFNTSYAENAVDPDEWNAEACAWLILGIEPSELADCDIIAIE